MKTGTKSILYGAHAFWLHPWFVAAAWTKLYGFPKDWRLWLAFFVHDLGYWGMEKMDDEIGETHPEWGAKIMARWCDKPTTKCDRCLGFGKTLKFKFMDLGFQKIPYIGAAPRCAACNATGRLPHKWHDFVLLHSRFYAKRLGRPLSQLAIADKLAITLEPWWLYLPRVKLTGEIKEYMALADTRHAAGEPRFKAKYAGMNVWDADERQWFENVKEYIRRWVEEHKDLKEDTWTPPQDASQAGPR